jgi:hypothetical protein
MRTKMKTKMRTKMRTKLLLLLMCMCTIGNYAQDLAFTFENARNTNDGANDYYEVDVYIAASEDFKLGSGLLYFNYNPSAFGESVKTTGNFEFLQPAGCILAEKHATISFRAYNSFVVNNNTSTRVAVSFQQGLARDAMTAANVTSTPRHLCSLRFKYEDINEDPNVEFETTPVFLDQFFTACGGEVDSDNFGQPDCTADPGVQLKNDSFDSSGSVPETLGVEDFNKENLLGMSVYPNPVSSELFIKGAKEKIDSIKIYNILGGLVKNVSVEALEVQMNVGDLHPGMYIIKLTSGESERTLKLIKR